MKALISHTSTDIFKQEADPLMFTMEEESGIQTQGSFLDIIFSFSFCSGHKGEEEESKADAVEGTFRFSVCLLQVLTRLCFFAMIWTT
jgi:hypothetical protein